MSDGAVLTICTAVVTIVNIVVGAVVYILQSKNTTAVKKSVDFNTSITSDAKDEARIAAANSAVAARNAAAAYVAADEHRLTSEQKVGELAAVVQTIQAAVVPNGTGEAKPSSLAKDGC